MDEIELVGREQYQHHCHPREKQRLLELDPPSDTGSGCLHPREHAGQQEKGNQNAGGGGRESSANLAAAGGAAMNKREKFQREYGKDARHEVQNEPARQRDADQRDKSAM